MALEPSILKGTKKILGLAEDYVVFDFDICTHINAALSNLSQFGVISHAGLVHVEDDALTWEDLSETFEFQNNEILGLVKQYVYLKVRTVFDPPQTSYLIEAMDKQIAEHEWRLSHAREMQRPYYEVPHWLVEEEEETV